MGIRRPHKNTIGKRSNGFPLENSVVLQNYQNNDGNLNELGMTRHHTK